MSVAAVLTDHIHVVLLLGPRGRTDTYELMSQMAVLHAHASAGCAPR